MTNYILGSRSTSPITQSLATMCVACFWVLTACSDPPSATRTGVIEIKLATSGLPEDLDPDGYSLWVDGRAYGAVATNKSLAINVDVGKHAVRLDDVAPNCSINGSNELTLEVVGGQSVTAAFDVMCVANIGALRVLTRTTGLDAKSYHYTAKLEGIGNVALGATDTVSYPNVRAGPLQITLTDISTNCVADGLNPRTVNVPFNDTAGVNFYVDCPYDDGELIAYVQYNLNDADIYVVHPDGTRPRQLTTNPGFDLSPAWSPDGKRIAFSSSNYRSYRGGSFGIFVMDDDGANQLRLTSGFDFGPSWSPDGSRIAFQRDSAIWLMNADGTNAVPLVGGSLYGSGPDWSPDGKRIAFSRLGNGITGIWTIGADGSNPVRVTSELDDAPAWSPDGKTIAFHRTLLGLDYHDDDNKNIYVVNSDGSALRQLTDFGIWAVNPKWKGDGRTIAFSGSTCFLECPSKLWLVDTQSLARFQIPTPLSAHYPAWRR